MVKPKKEPLSTTGLIMWIVVIAVNLFAFALGWIDIITTIFGHAK